MSGFKHWLQGHWSAIMRSINLNTKGRFNTGRNFLYALPAFAFFATILSQYVDNAVHHIVKNSQYGHHIIIILSTFCDNIVNHIVNFNNTVYIFVNRNVKISSIISFE